MDERKPDAALETLARELEESRRREAALTARVQDYRAFAVTARTYVSGLKLVAAGLSRTLPEQLPQHAAAIEQLTVDIESLIITRENALAEPVFPDPASLH